MIVKDAKGNELLDILPVEESEADALYSRIRGKEPGQG